MKRYCMIMHKEGDDPNIVLHPPRDALNIQWINNGHGDLSGWRGKHGSHQYLSKCFCMQLSCGT